jgi:hypothetical protein
VISSLEEATTLPLPDELQDPVAIRNGDDAFLVAFPAEQRDPTLGDLVTVEGPGEALQQKINDQVAPWRILETSNKYNGETQALLAAALGPEGQGIFESAADYQVIQGFLYGGKPGRTDDSTLGRVRYKVSSTLNIRPPEFYAAIQLQEVIPQETKPGQAPPTPVRNEDSEIITVIMKRVDGHLLRRPQMAMTFLMGVTTAVLCYMLHRRDKLAAEQRAAVAGAS